MSGMGWLAGQFVVCSGLILLSGIRLSRYGDIIARKTGLGGTWVGLLVMAAVTSLPELITGASAVVLFDVADIAAGDAIGSCMFNLVILALLDVRHPVPLSSRVHQGHVLSAGFGMVQLTLASLAILAGLRAPMVGWVALHSLLFLAVYAFAMRTLFVFERSRITSVAEELTGDISYKEVTLQRALVLYAANAALLISAATYLPGLGERLATVTGLGQSFVGSLFVAASTSLPEVVVSMAAARIGAVDMAVANLFGSNLFNIAVLGVDDLLYTRGSMLESVATVHLVTLTTATAMTAVAIIGLTYRASRKRYRLSWDALGIVLFYVTGTVLLRVLG